MPDSTLHVSWNQDAHDVAFYFIPNLCKSTEMVEYALHMSAEYWMLCLRNVSRGTQVKQGRAVKEREDVVCGGLDNRMPCVVYGWSIPSGPSEEVV